MTPRIRLPATAPDKYDIGKRDRLILVNIQTDEPICNKCGKIDNCSIYNLTTEILPRALRSGAWKIGECCHFEDKE